MAFELAAATDLVLYPIGIYALVMLVDSQLIETDDAGDAFDPRIAMDPNGNALAVWSQSDGTRYNIWANRLE